ncbi:MAG: methyltransferase domain-containing protein [Saprospiraceae bacterium]|nr:methyltransferase domain-containing protein [Saprospiraceae bacterium]MBK9222255.1 methyltransferase domain-containing protein [Saprospiraceae bacterium]MBK9722932.1 methyltransferase domain-containing protein [Saprospiraceae bacterium]
MMGSLEFLQESLKNMKTIGTVIRTSRFTSKAITDLVDFQNAKVIVELGAGDGAITHHILDRMLPDAVLIVFEVNKPFCEILNKINDNRIIVIHDSAEKLSDYLHTMNIDFVDCIISAIPFVMLPDDLAQSILYECKKCLKDGGDFIQIHYSLLKKKMYEEIFGSTKVNFVALNIPPVFIMHSKK